MDKQPTAPYTTTNPELLRLMAELKLSKNQIEQTVQAVAEGLTYDKTQELMLVVARNCRDFNEQNNYNKFAWLTRAAYISGFGKAMEFYSETIGQAIAKSMKTSPSAGHKIDD